MGANHTYGGRPAHPAADVFPMRPDEDIKQLADDIREHGLREPIVETSDGKVLDGRARLLACDLAGVPVWWHTYTGDDPWGYAITKNYETRQPTQDEAGFIGARVKHRPPGPIPIDPHKLLAPPRRRIAELLNTSRHSIDRARKVVARGVDGLAECVLKYEVPIQTAARISDQPPEQQHEFVAKVFGGMSPARAAGFASPAGGKRHRPGQGRNQYVNGARYRYIQREGITAIRDSMAVLRHLFDSTEGIAPDVDAVEAARLYSDLYRERRNLNRLMTLLKERTQ